MSKLTTPVERTNLRRLVHARVRAAILSGELTAGERFTETQLAEGLGTSRAPVREALRELEQEGLIVPSGQRGYELRPMRARDVEELCLLRIALERLAAGLAAERASASDLERLRTIVGEMRMVETRSQARGRRDDLDTTFHEELVRMSQHTLLLRTWLTMRDQLTLAMRAINVAWPGIPGFAESHERVVQAVASSDSGIAQAAIETHITAGVEKLLEMAGGSPAART